MVYFPNCKINLGLRILRRREDGFHDLETIFYPLPLCDVLEAVPAAAAQLVTTGRSIPGDPDYNLAFRAFRLLEKDFPGLPPVSIHLHKNIPIGGGLGGGSADGSFMLRLLNEQFRLGLDFRQLAHYAVRLGSDCPFFLLNRPCAGGGRGELLETLPLDLGDYTFRLIHPGIHISTAEAFAECLPSETGPTLTSLVARPMKEWRDTLVNDFERLVFAKHPILREIKSELYARGAVFAGMSGSGSCLFGIFERDAVEDRGWDPAFEVISLSAKK